MPAQEGRAATKLIERVCDGHKTRDPEGPLVTMVDGCWGYCAGHGDSDHAWRVIDPMQREELESAAT
jgi:hypothetical protein